MVISRRTEVQSSWLYAPHPLTVQTDTAGIVSMMWPCMQFTTQQELQRLDYVCTPVCYRFRQKVNSYTSSPSVGQVGVSTLVSSLDELYTEKLRISSG